MSRKDLAYELKLDGETLVYRLSGWLYGTKQYFKHCHT